MGSGGERLTEAQRSARAARALARERFLASKRTRQQETRRKILVGAVVLSLVERGVLDEKTFRGWMGRSLTRADDRALFGLSPPPR